MDQRNHSAIAVAPLHVLLVTNHEQSFLVFRHFLAEACNGQVLLDYVPERRALARVKKNHFDLALCDYRRATVPRSACCRNFTAGTLACR
jgi:DNA-binding NarL/FixJ family response regulator